MQTVNDIEPDPYEALARCSTSLEYHCKFFHSDTFSRPFSERHAAFFDLIDSTEQRCQIIAHRGFGKTKLCNLGIPSQKIMFNTPGEEKLIVPVSASATHAIMQTENLKREIKGNPLFREVVGEIKGDSDAKDMWTTSNGVMILPRGAGQQIRGIGYGTSRMDLGIVDDLENSEEVLSYDQRDKLKEWFMSDLLNSVDRSRDDWRIILIGTILHESSLMEDFRHDPSWTTIEIPLCDPEYNSYWPVFMDNDAIKELMAGYRHHGKIEVFYREYMNECMPREDAAFTSTYFQYYEEAEVDFSNPEIDTFILLDPAKTEKVHNDFTAIVGVSVDTMHNRVYVRDVVNRHLRPEEIYALTFDMADHLNTGVIGYEVTGLDEFIIQPMTDMMMSRGRHYELVELRARKAGEGAYKAKGSDKGKLARIGSLATYYRMGWMYHNKTCCDVLEQQLLAFPRAKYVDISDALAYFIEMMERGNRNLSDEMLDKEIERGMSSEEREYRKLEEEDEEPIY